MVSSLEDLAMLVRSVYFNHNVYHADGSLVSMWEEEHEVSSEFSLYTLYGKLKRECPQGFGFHLYDEAGRRIIPEYYKWEG